MDLYGLLFETNGTYFESDTAFIFPEINVQGQSIWLPLFMLFKRQT